MEVITILKPIKTTLTQTAFFAVVIFLFISMFEGSVRAEIYFYFDAENGTVGIELPHHQSDGGPNFCQPECSGLGARATYQSTGSVPQGNQYFQWETVDSQINHYCEIKNVGVFPVTEILGKTFYLAFYMRFDRKDGTDIWHEGSGTQSWDKGIEMRGHGVRWTVGWGQWDKCNGSYSPGFAANQDHHFTIGSGNPTYHLPGSEYNPNLNGYSCQNPPQLTYERWYAIILSVNMACDTTGSRTLWLNGVKIAESTGIQTTEDCSPNIDHITMGGTLAQPEYDSPSHYRKFDALILTDNWQDILDGGYLQDPEAGVTTPHTRINPDNFTLQQNYPNPFNPSTTIKYSVTKPCNVQIKIYNRLGQEVYALVNERKPAGEYNVTWNGKDAKGNKLASGVYYYRLTAGKQVDTKKMLYLQ